MQTCTNLIYFLQEENEIADMSPYFFSGGE